MRKLAKKSKSQTLFRVEPRRILHRNKERRKNDWNENRLKSLFVQTKNMQQTCIELNTTLKLPSVDE